jgi:hypothetical protein
VTLVWLILYLIISNGARHGGLIFDPLNWWAGTLILALSLDIYAS